MDVHKHNIDRKLKGYVTINEINKVITTFFKMLIDVQ